MTITEVRSIKYNLKCRCLMALMTLVVALALITFSPSNSEPAQASGPPKGCTEATFSTLKEGTLRLSLRLRWCWGGAKVRSVKKLWLRTSTRGPSGALYRPTSRECWWQFHDAEQRSGIFTCKVVWGMVDTGLAPGIAGRKTQYIDVETTDWGSAKIVKVGHVRTPDR